MNRRHFIKKTAIGAAGLAAVGVGVATAASLKITRRVFKLMYGSPKVYSNFFHFKESVFAKEFPSAEDYCIASRAADKKLYAWMKKCCKEIAWKDIQDKDILYIENDDNTYQPWRAQGTPFVTDAPKGQKTLGIHLDTVPIKAVRTAA